LELRTPRPLTFRHWAGISPYTLAYTFAETCVFGKQSLEPIFCGPLTPSRTRRAGRPTLPGHPFSRSYGVNLPSSLTEDRSSTLGRLPLPTSVGVRYGLLWHVINHLEAFLDGLGTTRLPSPHRRLPAGVEGLLRTGFAWSVFAPSRPTLSIWCGPRSLPCPPIALTPQVQDCLPALHRVRWMLPASA
jgi:hypothetical protein